MTLSRISEELVNPAHLHNLHCVLSRFIQLTKAGIWPTSKVVLDEVGKHLSYEAMTFVLSLMLRMNIVWRRSA
jgi:hypothetical protein